MIAGKPTHYIVLRSSYACEIFSGFKKEEVRDSRTARSLEGKAVGIAVSRTKDPYLQDKGWEGYGGKVVGYVRFGCARKLWPWEGRMKAGTHLAVEVEEYMLLPEEEHVTVAGGLGLRKLEEVPC